MADPNESPDPGELEGGDNPFDEARPDAPPTEEEGDDRIHAPEESES